MARFIKSFNNDAAIQAAVDDKSLGHPYVALNESAGTIDWDSKEIDPVKEYLTIKALESGNFYVRKSGIGYSVNGGAWETTTGETALSLNQGDAVRFKGTAGGNSLFSGNTLAFNAYGNVESLEYGDDFKEVTSVKNVSGFTSCFYGCTGLIDASNLILPATSLTSWCYGKMFYGCTSITKSPTTLPGSVLSGRVYNYMFGNCTSLSNSPDILAKTAVSYCANDMFDGCTSLNYIKCAITNAKSLSLSSPFGNWVKGVSPTGTFVKAAGADWKSGVSGIPSGWNVIEE